MAHSSSNKDYRFIIQMMQKHETHRDDAGFSELFAEEAQLPAPTPAPSSKPKLSLEQMKALFPAMNPSQDKLPS